MAGAGMTCNPVSAPAGIASIGLGGFGAGYNSMTAVENGMISDWGHATTELAPLLRGSESATAGIGLSTIGDVAAAEAQLLDYELNPFR